MIIVKLWGGLGNQLFQYAYGYQLAEKISTKMVLDVSWFEKHPLMQPNILKYRLKYNETLTSKDISLGVHFLNNRVVNRIIRFPSYVEFSVGSLHYLKESRGKFDLKLANYAKENSYVDGYWQCEEYFRQYTEDLKSQFSLSSYSDEIHRIVDKLNCTESVAIHIRRGDFVTISKTHLSNELVLLDKTYFDQTIQLVKNKIKNPFFYFFTDDVKWVKEQFSNIKNKIIVSEILQNQATEELLLMSKCQHQVISNSTFSWWAAWINSNPKKTIWAPDNGWSNMDMLPADWVRCHAIKAR